MNYSQRVQTHRRTCCEAEYQNQSLFIHGQKPQKCLQCFQQNQQYKCIDISQPNNKSFKMAYLNADTLEKSILGKSIAISDPICIQAAANIENVPGLKLKLQTNEWANAEMCLICKQPFNPQRNVNRHHCRICGGSACGQCSRKKVNNERVCDFCFLKQHLKKQEHERKEQFRLRQQNIERMTAQSKQFEIQIDNLDKQIQQVQKSNIELQISQGKIIAEKQEIIKKKQEQLKNKQEVLDTKKKQLNAKKEQLQTREERNKIYASKVQIIKLDISSKQTSLLQKMEELDRLKIQLDKLEIQKKELIAEFK